MVSCFVLSGAPALDSSGILLPYPVASLASHTTTILISLINININPIPYHITTPIAIAIAIAIAMAV